MKEMISLTLEENFLKEIDEIVKTYNFSSRTELIRAALREKIEELKLKNSIIAISKLKGISKKKTTEEDLEKIRELIFK
ncbi:MAG: ribbon-helix-helix domain-containing protein [Candidatus Woesearchaeota archaeon]